MLTAGTPDPFSIDFLSDRVFKKRPLSASITMRAEYSEGITGTGPQAQAESRCILIWGHIFDIMESHYRWGGVMFIKHKYLFSLVLLTAMSCDTSPDYQSHSYTNSNSKAPTTAGVSMDFRVYKMQSDLKFLGYDTGPCDGIMGPRTQTAIITFNSNHSPFDNNISGVGTQNAIYMEKTRKCGAGYSMPVYYGNIDNTNIHPGNIPYNPYSAENGIYYGETSSLTGRPKTIYVRSQYRSPPQRP